MRRCFIAVLLLLILSSAGLLLAQAPIGDVLGSHDLSPGSSSSMKGGSSSSCMYCHAPHSGVGLATPLWAQTLSSQTYQTYTSPTAQNTAEQPTIGGDSSLCLSCHDGTVAVGTSVPYGKRGVTGAWTSPTTEVLGPNLQGSHPFSLKLDPSGIKDASNLVASLAASHTTADLTNSVKLINNNVECTSCHNPHVQSIDKVSLNFLVMDNIRGQVCLSCHETGARTVNSQPNPLAGWTTSIHATAADYKVAGAAKLGSYSTVAEFACLSCHMPHNSAGGQDLLRTPASPLTGVDATSQTCLICHNGSNLTPTAPNIGLELTSPKVGHPYPAGTNQHASNEPAVLLNNRHSTCVDCHNAHDSAPSATLGPAPGVRGSQTGVVGVSMTDGVTPVNPAANQYETCVRCHGTSTGKPTTTAAIYGYQPNRLLSDADRQNVIPEFSSSAPSSHPVGHDNKSPFGQPSLRPFMKKLDGVTDSTRPLNSGPGFQLFCTDCHNADDNREFGGLGPNGPHGSQFSHILERRYEYSTVAPGPSTATTGPGSPILIMYPFNPSAGGSAPGPYALCGKCHDLNNLITNASFKSNSDNKGGHNTHLTLGVSCSVCHSPHGVGAQSGTLSGQRMLNFDTNVVAPNGTSPIAYSPITNTCTLTCHSKDHFANGDVKDHQ